MNYVVLRADVELESDLDFAKPRSWRTAKRAVSRLDVEVTSGHENDVGRLRADPRNVAGMEAGTMFSLIAPTLRATFTASDGLQANGTQQQSSSVQAVGAHTSAYDGQGVTVALLDTGIDKHHPAFVDKELFLRDFTGEGQAHNDVTDRDGHGTHCAGTVCGGVVDGVRVGVAPGVARLCVGKVVGERGASLPALLKGLLWAVHNRGASVVSLALEYDLAGNTKRLIDKYGVNVALASQRALQLHRDVAAGIAVLRAFLASQSPNVVIVAASGNASRRPEFVLEAVLPAAELVAVGAVGSVAVGAGRWALAPFSNARVRLVAPGVEVVSAAVAGGWASMSGTSMSSAHVAGVAALWMQRLRSQGTSSVPGAVLAELLASATTATLRSAADRNAIGMGMVQAPQ